MLTKLEAVNLMLDAIGEVPVSSLDNGYPDAKKAERILDRVSKEVQGVGWNCNSEEEAVLAIDADGLIAVADEILRIKPAGYDTSFKVIPRAYSGARYLYDVRGKTFVFKANLTADVTYLFEFEALTPELQNYIALRASREFQDSDISSVVLDQKLARREAEAFAKLEDAEAESQPTNILTDSTYCRAVTFRYNRLYGV